MIFHFHGAEIGSNMVSSWLSFALSWFKELHVGSSRLQVGHKLAQAASKLTLKLAQVGSRAVRCESE